MKNLIRFPGKNLKSIIAASLAIAIVTANGAVQLDSHRVAQIAKSLPQKPTGVGRPISDRAAWDQFAHKPGFAGLIAIAERLARSPDPELPDDLFLDYSRTGNRDRCQHVMFERASRLSAFTIAECLENKGRFIGPLTNTIAALCSEKTWLYPAHDGKLNNFYGRSVDIDLRSSALGWELATVDWLIGDKLPRATRELIRENVRRRILQPYRDMIEGRRPEISWLHATHNWNAVCLAGVTGAALAEENSREGRAQFVAATEIYIQNFLKGFTPDGYCSEGLGYWNYGFGNFVSLAETVRQATGGAVDFLADSKALAPARFPRRDEILDGIYPSIADCSPGTRPDERTLRYLDERFGFTTEGNRDEIFVRDGRSVAGTALYAFLPSTLPQIRHAEIKPDSPLRTWFNDGGVLICRTAPDAKAKFAVALKGGNNAEHHNHNDIGSFSVVTGGKIVLCDPGAEVYTARTFGSKRYDSKVLNSFGHAVPVVAGKLQRTGATARGVVLRADFSDDADTLALDVSSAYNVPELKKLERTFVFSRKTNSLSVRDEVAFASPQTFESALITWGDWKNISENEIIVRDGDSAVRVKIETGGAPFEIHSELINEDVRGGRKPTRIGIALKSPVEKASVTLAVTPDA